MSEEKLTRSSAPDGMEETQDVLPERLIRTTQAVHTGGDTKRIIIPEAEAPVQAPARRFIKTNEPEFVSARAGGKEPDDPTAVMKYTDRLDAPAPAAPAAPAEEKENTYDTVHAPAEGARMIGGVSENQLRMEGVAVPPAEELSAEEAFGEQLQADEDTISIPTRPFDIRGDRLREIADTAGEDVRRNPDQMMMEGFDEIGKKTEEELASEEKLKDELKLSRAERVKNFRFWNKAPDEETEETPADEKFTSDKKVTALPSFAEKFAARFAHIPTLFTPVKTAEYTDAANRKTVFDAIKKSRARAFLRLVLLAAFALILLITDIAAKATAGGNNGFFTVFGGSVNALAAFNLVFLLLACGVMLPDLKNGAITVLKLRPKTEALLLLLMLSAAAQTVTAFLTQQKLAHAFQLLAPAAVLVCVPYMLSKVFYYDNARQVFKTVSVKSDKSYLRKVTDPELRARLCVEEGQNAVYIGRTRAVGGFPASAEGGARGEMPATRVTAALALVSLLTALIVTIIKRSPASGLTVLTLCLALCVPVCGLAAGGFFLSRTNGRLSLKSSFIQTFQDAKTFSVIDTVSCDAAELFDAEITNCLTAKGVTEKQARFAAASAAAGADSMIRKVFAAEIETYAEKMPPAKNTVYEDKMGISAYVGGCTVLLGNHDMMLNHNVNVPNESAVQRLLKEDEKPLYLSMEGRFTALFAVKYTAQEDVTRGIKGLVNGGAALLLSTTDPNISDSSAEAILELPENSVRMIGSTAAKKLAAAKSAVSDSEEVGVVFTDSFLSLARVAVQAVKLNALRTVCGAVSLGGAAVSLLLGMVLAFTGAFAKTTALPVLFLQGAWLGLCFLSPLFSKYAIQLTRRVSALREKKNAAEAPAGAEEEAPAQAEPVQDLFTVVSAAEEAAEAQRIKIDENVQPDELDGFILPETQADAAPEAPAEESAQPEETAEDAAPPEEESEEDAMLRSLQTFAPKEEPKAPVQEEEKEAIIASPAMKATLSSVNEFYSELTANEPASPEEGKTDFSLYGKDTAARRGPSADDIETAYERSKADEAAVRRAFTAPQAPAAPLYDLRRTEPEPPAKDPEPPLDTSDVNVFNDELFRRFEDDDAIFSGLHDDEETRDYQF